MLSSIDLNRTFAEYGNIDLFSYDDQKKKVIDSRINDFALILMGKKRLNKNEIFKNENLLKITDSDKINTPSFKLPE